MDDDHTHAHSELLDGFRITSNAQKVYLGYFAFGTTKNCLATLPEHTALWFCWCCSSRVQEHGLERQKEAARSVLAAAKAAEEGTLEAQRKAEHTR